MPLYILKFVLEIQANMNKRVIVLDLGQSIILSE